MSSLCAQLLRIPEKVAEVFSEEKTFNFFSQLITFKNAAQQRKLDAN